MPNAIVPNAKKPEVFLKQPNAIVPNAKKPEVFLKQPNAIAQQCPKQAQQCQRLD